MKALNIVSWACRIVAAVILLQTLYFKFTAQPESVELFSKLGAEPWGRIGTGVIELIASILLLIPRTAFFGGALAVGLMIGAIGSHIAVLGLETKGDGGLLFIFAITVLICAAVTCFIHRSQGWELLQKTLKRQSV